MALTKKQAEAISEIRKLAKRQMFTDLIFEAYAPEDGEKRHKMEASLRRRFEAWFDTWVEPQLEKIEGSAK